MHACSCRVRSAELAAHAPQGEDQKKLDIVSNEVFCNALRNSGKTGVIASEEEDLPVAVEETYSGDTLGNIMGAECVLWPVPLMGGAGWDA